MLRAASEGQVWIIWPCLGGIASTRRYGLSLPQLARCLCTPEELSVPSVRWGSRYLTSLKQPWPHKQQATLTIVTATCTLIMYARIAWTSSVRWGHIITSACQQPWLRASTVLREVSGLSLANTLSLLRCHTNVRDLRTCSSPVSCLCRFGVSDR